MVSKQGDLALLDHPVAQRLLHSAVPARLAYVWSDGTPRVVPIGFHWTGEEMVFGTAPDAPKMSVLQDGTPVAVTVDSERMPHDVLLLRGRVHSDTVDGLAPEYVQMCYRTMGDEGGQAWIDQVTPLITRMTRVFVRPEWVGVLDFQTRLPSRIERALEHLQASA